MVGGMEAEVERQLRQVESAAWRAAVRGASAEEIHRRVQVGIDEALSRRTYAEAVVPPIDVQPRRGDGSKTAALDRLAAPFGL
jgi:hypothetical protein